MSSTPPRRRSFVIALAALAWFSILLQGFLSLQTARLSGESIGRGIVGFLGYFTVLTNLLVCISLTLPLVRPAAASGKLFSRADIIAGVATSIAFVGLAYHLLLRNTWNPQGLQFVANVLLHYVIPALYLTYWWFDSPKTGVRWISPFIWGIYPTSYLVYALIRGRVIGSYPYGFIDAAAIGYGQTMINGLGLLLAFIVLGLVVTSLDRARARRWTPLANGG
jgi:hypothetical protein